MQAGDSQRGGADCSPRCRQVNAALDAATAWLQQNERPAQLELLRGVG